MEESINALEERVKKLEIKTKKAGKSPPTNLIPQNIDQYYFDPTKHAQRLADMAEPTLEQSGFKLVPPDGMIKTDAGWVHYTSLRPEVDWEKVAEAAFFACTPNGPEQWEDQKQFLHLHIDAAKAAVAEYVRQSQKACLDEVARLEAMKSEPFYWNNESWLAAKTARIEQEVRNAGGEG